MKKVCWLVCIVFLSLSVWAQTAPTGERASREDVVKLMDVMHCREMMKSTMAAMSAQMLPAMHQRLKKADPAMTETELAEYDKIMNDYLNLLPLDAMYDAMIPAYQKNLTSTEVRAMTDFYSSPVGQSVLSKMPGITADAMREVQPIMMKSMDGLDSYMKKKMEELHQKYPRSGN